MAGFRELTERAEELAEQGREAEERVDQAQAALGAAQQSYASAASYASGVPSFKEDGSVNEEAARARMIENIAQAEVEAAERALEEAKAAQEAVRREQESHVREMESYEAAEGRNLEKLNKLGGMAFGENAQGAAAGIAERMAAVAEARAQLQRSMGMGASAGGSPSLGSFGGSAGYSTGEGLRGVSVSGGGGLSGGGAAFGGGAVSAPVGGGLSSGVPGSAPGASVGVPGSSGGFASPSGGSPAAPGTGAPGTGGGISPVSPVSGTTSGMPGSAPAAPGSGTGSALTGAGSPAGEGGGAAAGGGTGGLRPGVAAPGASATTGAAAPMGGLTASGATGMTRMRLRFSDPAAVSAAVTKTSMDTFSPDFLKNILTPKDYAARVSSFRDGVGKFIGRDKAGKLDDSRIESIARVQNSAYRMGIDLTDEERRGLYENALVTSGNPTTRAIETKADRCLQSKALGFMKRPEFSVSRWELATSDERKKSLEQLKRDMNTLFGLDVVDDIIFEYMPPKKDEDGNITGYTRGIYSQADNSIHINSEYVLFAPEYSRELINTVVHEMRHAYQHHAVSHPELHLVSEETRRRWEDNFKPGHYKTGNTDEYLAQPIEWDAKSFAGQSAELIRIRPEYEGSWKPRIWLDLKAIRKGS